MIQIDGRNGKRRRACVLEDGITLHGPVIEIDERGRERVVGRTVRGKREGYWKYTDDILGTTEAYFKNGVPDGRVVIRSADGQIVLEREYRDGVAHGRSRFWSADGFVSRTEHHEGGKPTGTWEWFAADGSVTERLVYGEDGVLLSIDGRPVPPPPSQIELADGSVIERRECVRIAETSTFEDTRGGCLDLFERLQTCGDDDCRGRILEEAARRR